MARTRESSKVEEEEEEAEEPSRSPFSSLSPRARVFFLHRNKLIHGLGSFADANDQQTRRERVERARVPDFDLLVFGSKSQGPTKLGAGVVRRPSQRLVDKVGCG